MKPSEIQTFCSEVWKEVDSCYKECERLYHSQKLGGTTQPPQANKTEQTAAATSTVNFPETVETMG